MSQGNPELRIGQVPQPRYLQEAGDTTGSGNIKWIGIDAYSIDKVIKPFLWWRNFQIGDLDDVRVRHDAAAFVARLKIEMEADSAIGPAIDLHGSNPRAEEVKLLDEPEVYGVYVEADKRPMFNFMSGIRGVRSEAELRRENPALFYELVHKAEAVLPRPNQPEKKSSSEVKLDPRIEFVVGDLTEVEAEAIVCPSLPDLDVLYTGVAGAIMRKGGDKIFAEARAIGEKARKQNPKSQTPVPFFSAHLTNGGNLPKAKYVIHSVAVRYTDQGLECDPEAIFKSAWNVLNIADQNKLKSVAFPALGAGLYQIPLEQSFGAIAQASDRFLKEHPETLLGRIKLVSLDPNLARLRPTLMEELIADDWIRSLRKRVN